MHVSKILLALWAENKMHHAANLIKIQTLPISNSIALFFLILIFCFYSMSFCFLFLNTNEQDHLSDTGWMARQLQYPLLIFCLKSLKNNNGSQKNKPAYVHKRVLLFELHWDDTAITMWTCELSDILQQLSSKWKLYLIFICVRRQDIVLLWNRLCQKGFKL